MTNRNSHTASSYFETGYASFVEAATQETVAKKLSDAFDWEIATVLARLGRLLPAAKTDQPYEEFMEKLRAAAAHLLAKVAFPEGLSLNAHPEDDYVFEIDGAFHQSWALELRLGRRSLLEYGVSLPKIWRPRLAHNGTQESDLYWMHRAALLLAKYRAAGIEITKAQVRDQLNLADSYCYDNLAEI
jgi:hypothetical protein